jgi:hypothetical protein
MVFDGWPVLGEGCPVCGGLGCAIYKGYYSRELYCPELEYLGPVAIRTGLCKSRKIRFTLMPEFLIRYKRISTFSYRQLHDCYREQGLRLQSTIDALLDGLGDEFYLPLSTAYLYLQCQYLPP